MKRSVISTSIALALGTISLVHAGEGKAAEHSIGFGITRGANPSVIAAVPGQPMGQLQLQRGITESNNTLQASFVDDQLLINIDVSSLGDCTYTGATGVGNRRNVRFFNSLEGAYVTDNKLQLTINAPRSRAPSYQGMLTVDCQPVTDPEDSRAVDLDILTNGQAYSIIADNGQTVEVLGLKGPTDQESSKIVGAMLMDWSLTVWIDYTNLGCAGGAPADAGIQYDITSTAIILNLGERPEESSIAVDLTGCN